MFIVRAIKVVRLLFSLQRVLWNLHKPAVLDRRLMGDNAGDGHVQRLPNVDLRFAVFEDRHDELMAQVPVRAAVFAEEVGDFGFIVFDGPI